MELVLDMSNPAEKRTALELLRGLEGMHRVEVVKYRPRRTDRQNRFYWPCVAQPFGDFLRAQGESYTDEDAHELLKAKFLMRTVVNKETGEVIGNYPRSTTELSVDEFAAYIDQCIAWLADMFHIQCPLPEEHHV